MIAADFGPRTVRSMTTTMTLEGLDPRHTFLSARDVFARYGWGKTQGYVHLKTPGFPRPVLGGKYRLDTLLAWEDGQVQPVPDPPVDPSTDSGPPAKRAPGRKAA
ncbi:hypothetical protein GCM10023146_41430 [Nocardioides caricicola]